MRRCLALFAIPLAACATDTPERLGAVVRDSGGVRIVENTSPQWLESQQWRLTEEPIVDIGGGDTAEEQLHRVRGAARLSDGRIVVADGGSQELRFYAPSGEHERSAGGRGGGRQLGGGRIR
jgi:hypothetical protein